jgi:hypothetical protein
MLASLPSFTPRCVVDNSINEQPFSMLNRYATSFPNVVLLSDRQHNKFQINKPFVYYSVSATCFDPAGSSSGSFHDTSLVTELCSNMDPY